MKAKYLVLTFTIMIIVNCSMAQKTGTYTDSRDGKTYKTVKIGNQWWMAENLAYKASSGCWAYNNDNSNVAKYGYLYNWETAKSKCPYGWHLPSRNEWDKFLEFCKIENDGKMLKSSTAWNGTDNFGFNAIPGGLRMSGGVFDCKDRNAFWWTSDEETREYIDAWYKFLFYADGFNMGELSKSKDFGYSVRCVCDNANNYEAEENQRISLENERKIGMDIISYGKFKNYIIGVSTYKNVVCSECYNTNMNVSDYITNEYKALGDNFSLKKCKDEIITLSDIDFSVNYYFYNNYLFEVDLSGYSSSLEKLNQLVTVFITKYGDPTYSDKSNGGKYNWSNSTNYLSLMINTDYNVKVKYYSKSLLSSIYDDFVKSLGNKITNETKKF